MTEPQSEGNERLEALLVEASVARGRGDHRKALALLEAAEVLDQTDARTWDLRGDVHADRSHFDLAMGCYQKALELDPDMPETHDKLGLAALGRLEAAKLSDRAQRGSEAASLRRRSQIAMISSIVFPGLGHLWLEQYLLAALYAVPAAACLLCASFLLEHKALHPGSMFSLWLGYGCIGLLVVLWIVAFIHASHLAAQRDDEKLY
jgi:tetratricopeptide (TPR) repeat protein